MDGYTVLYSNNIMKIIKNFISFDFVELIQDYFSIKVNSNQFDKNCQQIEFGYSFYSDVLIETILQNCCENVAEETATKIFPSHSLSRLYTKNETLIIKEDNNYDYCGIIFLGSSNDESKTIKIFLINQTEEKEILLNVGDLFFIEKNKFNDISIKMDDNLTLFSFLYFVKENNMDFMYDGRPYLGFPKSS